MVCRHEYRWAVVELWCRAKMEWWFCKHCGQQKPRHEKETHEEQR